jgi:hypothetical protein
VTDPPATGSASIHIHTAEHQLTQHEVVPVFYWQVLHRWQYWILPVAGICVAAAGAAVLVLDSQNRVAWVVMLTVGLVILLIFLVLVPLTPRRIWKRVQKQFEIRTLEISEEGIHRHTTLNDSTMRWPMFSELQRRNDVYLLVVGKGPGCFIIPRRAFISENDETMFCELVERSVLGRPDPDGTVAETRTLGPRGRGGLSPPRT